MVWGDGGAYATWFSSAPEQIQGINQLPITGGHLYLGYNPGYVMTNYNEMITNRGGGQPAIWPDILYEFLALGNGDQALASFRANNGFASEEGESKAHTFHWIRNLATLGNVDTSVTADQPLAATFVKNGTRTYVVSNTSNAAVTVHFSNGTNVAAPAGRTVASGAMNWSGGSANGGTNPSGGPTSTPISPSPSTSTSPSPPPIDCTPAPAALLSRGRPVSTSSTPQNGYPATNAVDASATTRWSSGTAANQWLRVDLGSSQSVGRVRLNWHSTFGTAYQIQTSPNGNTWTTVYSTTTGDGGVDDLTVAGTGRYVRINGSARTGGRYSLWDFEVYGVASTCTSPSPSTSPTGSPPGGTGSPTQYLQGGGVLSGTAAGGAATATVASAGNGQHEGTPVNQLTYTATGLTMAYNGGATNFDLYLDAGSGVGNGTQARVSYDLTGDGTFDRIETYRYFATDPVPGYEHYTQAWGLSSSSGALGDLSNGQMKVEVWNAIGNGSTTLGTGNQSVVRLPYS
jgi:hypothetical protein